MLTTIDQILAWFADYSKTHPYWVLYNCLDKPDSTKRRGFNWETSDVLKATSLLKATLERFAPMGGGYFLTCSDKPKDNAPSGSTNIMFGAANNSGSVGVNGVMTPYSPQTASDTIALHVANTELKLRLEMEQRERERDKQTAGVNGIFGWLQGLSNHPNFDPNIPFSLLGGIFGNLFGLNGFAANPQGLPDAPQVAPPSVPTANKQEIDDTAEKADFTYDVAKIAKSYHDFCQTMNIPLSKRNEFLEILNNNVSQLPPAQRQMMATQLTGSLTQN